MNEHDLVALRRDVEEHGLRTGDVGTVVLVHSPSHMEVEFISAAGETIVVLTLAGEDIRPLGGREILHVRNLASVA